jgi:PAS domain S-box-containing protein
MVADEAGVIQLFNVGAERMLGYASAEVVNKIHLVDFHDPQEVSARTRELSLEFSTAVASGFETLIFKASRGIEDCYELAYLCKDGSRLPASVSISALRDDEGTNIGYLLVGADESVRKQLESKLKNALLDSENADLAKANRLANVCHEIRTPLNAILGFAQLMSSALPSPTSSQKRNIDLIIEAGWHQQKLISEFLDLALLDSGKLPLSLEPISVAEIVLECQQITEPQAQTRGVNLAFPTFGTPHFVRADRIRLRQVVANLLSHAIGRSKTCGHVVMDCDTRKPEHIRFCIQDSGGLSADHLLEGKDAPDGNGEGVNMVLTKRLVESMGGTIGVGSNAGTDRILWFELERVAYPASAESPLTDSFFGQASSSSRKRRTSRKRPSPGLTTSK